jgi:hypothetical protein
MTPRNEVARRMCHADSSVGQTGSLGLRAIGCGLPRRFCTPRSAPGLTWRAPFLRRERDQSLSHRRLGRAAADDGNQPNRTLFR